jgi:uncharacterized membrane protein YccC
MKPNALGQVTTMSEHVATLEEIITCAKAWDPQARLIGNITAESIIAACEYALQLQSTITTLDTLNGLGEEEGLSVVEVRRIQARNTLMESLIELMETEEHWQGDVMELFHALQVLQSCGCERAAPPVIDKLNELILPNE